MYSAVAAASDLSDKEKAANLYERRLHIHIERLDAMGKYDEIMEIMYADKDLREFCEHHINNTCFEWGIKKHPPFKRMADKQA